jgi:hypothetical protein
MTALHILALLTLPLLACTKALPPKQVDGELVFTGMCDASAAVPLDDHTFVVADDEDNVLRAYDSSAPGAPLWSVDVSAGIGIAPKPGKKAGPPEADIESATRVGALSFWMTSHGRNSSGKAKPERLRLFAASLPAKDQPLKISGRPYEHLLDDLLAEPRLSRFGLKEASQRAPKSAGGLNLEGMTARSEGGVWIGFRNPIPEGRALLVPLLNPEQLVADGRAQFGEPQLLDLGGLGVRAISHRDGQYLILAGPFDGSGSFRLFRWDGASQLSALSQERLDGINPEGFFTPQGRPEVLLLSDDGSVAIDGTECKRLKEPARKRFRARWIKL